MSFDPSPRLAAVCPVLPRPLAVATLLALLAPVLPGSAAAQSAAPATTVLPDVVVTGNPLRRADVIGPVDVLAGDGLVLRRAATLGETLAGLSGVSGTGFGPNASRPVLRGLDGDRVRLLSNTGSSLDASSLSFDHAVAIDPLVVERVEVLRGPSALLYGGNAIGGVVNSLDNRIPKQAMDGVGGRAELRLGSAARERAAAAVIEGGSTVAPGSALAWHADLAGRRADDLRVPAFQPVRDGVVEPSTRRIANSAADSHAGAAGLSWIGDASQVGVSVDRMSTHYGTVADPEVTIRMRRRGAALAGEWRAPADGIALLRARVDHSRYGHEELEADGAVGTTFRNRGTAGRLELEHEPLAGWQGLVGAQFERSRFSALGDEAFVPSTSTRQQAVFLVEERELGPADAVGAGRVSLGLRAEQARIGSEGDDAAATETRFGAADQRRFGLLSGSVGGLWRVAPGWEAQASLSHSERAPTYYELYANGLHLATAAYERGDASLKPERGRNLDLALAWKSGTSQARLGVWASRFDRYLLLGASGETVPLDDGQGGTRDVPVYAFRAVRAALSGVELSGRQAWAVAEGRLTLDARVDALRGTDRDSGQPLPRLVPWRARLGLGWAQGPATWRAEIDHAARQSRVPADDIATPGYTLLNLAFTWRQRFGPADALLFAKLDNVGNTLAYNAAAIRTVRELAPAAGRSLALGLQARF